MSTCKIKSIFDEMLVKSKLLNICNYFLYADFTISNRENFKRLSKISNYYNCYFCALLH